MNTDKEPTVTFCTQRIAVDKNGIDEIHLECRFSDGQKFAAVIVDSDFPELANRIETFLNMNCEPAMWELPPCPVCGKPMFEGECIDHGK
jgi:hypothetical protein